LRAVFYKICRRDAAGAAKKQKKGIHRKGAKDMKNKIMEKTVVFPCDVPDV
jgi:hypothetical protein